MRSLITLRFSKSEAASNPLWALAFAILVGIAMVSITFLIFIKSSAYETVQQIQIGASKQADLGPGYDVTSPVNAKDIDAFNAKIESKLNSIDDNADFNESKVSEATLGL
jgi:hypothetical protein